MPILLGQLRPGGTVRFRPDMRSHHLVAGPTLSDAVGTPNVRRPAPETGSAILVCDDDGPVPMVFRRQGDDNLLVEYEPMALDIGLRLRVQLLAEAAVRLPGLIDLTPGIRSLQIHYDGESVSRWQVLGILREIEAGLPPVEAVSVPSRTVHLPLSWNDPQAELAMREYQVLVHPNAPWRPSNIEFIRRISDYPTKTRSARSSSTRSIS